jgi:HK97 family phage major capsid protein
MTESIFTSAGWLVPVEMESAIIANREQYGVARRICNVIPMGSATLTIPRVTSDITAYFVGEGTSGTASDSAGDQVQLNLKDLMAYTKVGKSTAMDAVVPLAEMVAREQARAFAIKEDACLILGDGTSTYGGMQGIVTLLETAAYAGGRGAAATNHDTFAEIDASDVATVIGKLPVYARAGARFVASGVAEALVFGRLKLTAGGQDTQTLQGGVVEQSYAGFPVSVAHNMPAGATTDYSTKVMLLLGNFQLGVAFGSGSGMMLTVDPYTLADQNLTRVITTERIDIVAHGVNKSTTVAGPIVCLYGD